MRACLAAGVVLLVVSAGVSAASATSSAPEWSNTGPAWTKKQARSALLDARRIYALNVPGFFENQYVFGIGAIFAIRAHGPSVKVKGVPAWRRFEVRAILNPLVPVPENPNNPSMQFVDASFCLHAGKPWRLTGFDTILYGRISYGCRDTKTTRSLRGGLYQ